MDWATWPIFVLQLLTFGSLFLSPNTKILGCTPRNITITLILITCMIIVLSLHHDSTDALHLYF